MKRDMELIRAILLEVEKSEYGYFRDKLKINGYTEEEIGYHSYLIIEAGLADGPNCTVMGSKSPEAEVTSLTWEGHDFLDAVKNENVWNKSKEKLKKVGSASLSVVKDVAVSVLKKELGLD